MTPGLPMGINDRRLRAFFAVRGYPDPATVSQERTIWAVTEHRTRTSRICSASSTRQVVTVIDPEILKAVQTVYSTDLGLPEGWTREQRDQFLMAEADKISSMASSMAEELWEKAIAAWSRNRNGKTPNHATKVALLEAARAQAAQTVLNNELYDLIETDETTPPWETPDQIPDPAHLGWEQRWTNPRISERAQRGPRSADRPPLAGPELFGTVPDQGGIPDLGPSRGRPAATRPPRGPADRRVGADDLPRPARGRSARAVGPQVSLFDDLADDTEIGADLNIDAELLAAQPVEAAADVPVAATSTAEPSPAPPPDVAAAEFRSAADFPASTDVLVPSGAKARARANIAAIELVQMLRDAQRPATLPEQRILAAWSGWGAIPQVFDPRAEDFTAERAQLAGLLTPEQYRRAQASILNAHYTDPAVVAAVWDALGAAGFSGGPVLEPGCGSGTFIGHAPEGATMVGVEADDVTAAIAALLYPSAQVRHEGFETTRVPEASFTAAIGNVPFGRYALTDPLHNPRRHSIHNHFIIKSLSLVAPGGYVAVLTSRYTMDCGENELRGRTLLREPTSSAPCGCRHKRSVESPAPRSSPTC